jgi:hypothetical protein
MKNLFYVLLGIIAIGILIVSPKTTNALLLEYTWEFSGAVPPQGSTLPYLTAEFVDMSDGSDNYVQLTMSTSGLVDDEFVDGASEGESDAGWLFNFDPSLDPFYLNFEFIGGTKAADIVETGINSFKADGDGSYDIRFAWDQTDPLSENQTSIYKITSTELVFNSDSFNFLSQPPTGGKGPFLSVVHVQGIDDPTIPGVDTEGSGWVTVPDASVMLLLGSSLMGLAIFSRKDRSTR